MDNSTSRRLLRDFTAPWFTLPSHFAPSTALSVAKTTQEPATETKYLPLPTEEHSNSAHSYGQGSPFALLTPMNSRRSPLTACASSLNRNCRLQRNVSLVSPEEYHSLPGEAPQEPHTVTPDGGEAQKASRRGEQGGEERQRDTSAQNRHGKGLNLTIQTHFTEVSEGKEPNPRKSIHRLLRRFFLNLSEARTSPTDQEVVKGLPGCVSPRGRPVTAPRPVPAAHHRDLNQAPSALFPTGSLPHPQLRHAVCGPSSHHHVHSLTMKEPPLLHGQDAQAQRLARSGNVLSGSDGQMTGKCRGTARSMRYIVAS